MRILLSIMCCFCALAASAQEADRQRYIQLTYKADKTYVEKASETIYATSTIPVQSTVEYQAGRSITLKPGFLSSHGSVFTAHIRHQSDAVMQLTAFPNPFDESTTITFDLPEAGLVNLVVVDASGQVVGQLLNNSKQTAGRHQIDWKAASLPPGIYMPVLKTGRNQLSKRILKK